MNLQDQIKKQFFDSSISFYVKGLKGEYLDVNQAFFDQTYLGDYQIHSSSEILGQKDIDLWNGQAPLFHMNDQKVRLLQTVHLNLSKSI